MTLWKRLFVIVWLAGIALVVFRVVGLAASSSRPLPTPPCHMENRAGYLELSPAGTISATTFIYFDPPFCSNNYVLGANLVTPFDESAERPNPTVRLHAPGVAAVTIRLSAPGDVVYKVHWTAVEETQ